MYSLFIGVLSQLVDEKYQEVVRVLHRHHVSFTSSGDQFDLWLGTSLRVLGPSINLIVDRPYHTSVVFRSIAVVNPVSHCELP